MSQMIEVKTAELIGAALDWSVAKAECAPVELPASDVVWHKYAGAYSPSTNWAQGGPLIEKYRIEPRPYNGIIDGKLCEAWKVGSQSHTEILVAACRCIVVRELGEVVSVPSELVGGEK